MTTEDKKPATPPDTPSTQPSQPGRLRGSYSITLHTRQAQRLFRGRRKTDDKPGIIGLTAFSAIMTRVWEAAGADDPYADWFLLQVERAIEETRKLVHTRQQDVDKHLSSRERVKIEVASSLEPVVLPLNFPTPYGYMGAYLIEDFDQLVLSLLTAVHVALIPRDTAMATLSNTSRAIRRAFLTPAHHKLLGITRKDIVMTTQRGAQAITAMGNLPPEILEGTLRSRFAPPIRTPAIAEEKAETPVDTQAAVDLLDDEDNEDEPAATDLDTPSGGGDTSVNDAGRRSS
jgi:integrating conjugative element protein (TIGR03761 family)